MIKIGECMSIAADPMDRASDDVASAWPTTLSPAELALVEVPTPFLALDLTAVRDAYDRLVSAFSGRIEVCYAVKCNPDAPVLEMLAAAGSNFEIASAPELELLLPLGVDPSRVLYSNPVKPPTHVQRTYAQGVRRFVVDCLGEVDKIAQHAPAGEVFARVRVDDTRSRFPLSSKFGLPVGEAAALLLAARDRGLRPMGLTFHVGSQCTDAGAWGRAVDSLGPVLRELAGHGVVLDMLDIGGGFPARYDGTVPGLAAIGAATLGALARLPYVPAEIVCEPGRAIVAEAAVLATSVIGRENRMGREWVYLDAGAYNGLMEAEQTRGLWQFPVRTSREDTSVLPAVSCTLTGPTCDSSDTLLNDADVPGDLELGDHVYIGSAGAYSICYASSFNGFGPPERVYVRG
jgi:ornithine decarboxylase